MAVFMLFQAAKYGTVALITKTDLRESNSFMPREELPRHGQRRRPIFHYSDTITRGRGLCDNPAVDILVNEGPERDEILMGRHVFRPQKRHLYWDSKASS
jgi:L-aspartate oxidase